MNLHGNILFVVNSLTFGGTEKQAVILLNQLDTSKFSLSLAYFRRKEDLLTELDRKRLKSVSCYGGTNFVEFPLPSYLARIIDAEQIDTVVCFNHRPTLYAFLARALARKTFRIVAAIHKAELGTKYQVLKNRLLYKPLFKRCDLVTFSCESHREDWVNKGWIHPRNTHSIYNGIDVDHFNNGCPDEKIRKIRNELGFGENSFVIGVSARLHTRKNHAELIPAIELLHSKGLDARLLMIGDGPERGNLESIIKSKSLDRHVVVTGFKKDVRPFLSVCDCITLTSCAEGFPLATLEAMAMGKPVISSDVGGAKEQIENGVNGFLYQPGDIESLAGYMMKLADPNVRAELGIKARQTVVNNFTIEKMVFEYTRILEQT